MGTGETLSRDKVGKRNPLGANLPDPFFDSYEEESFTCHDIIDLIALHDRNYITLTFDKAFLRKILISHIRCVVGILNNRVPHAR